MKKYCSLFVTAILCTALNAQAPQNAPGDIAMINSDYSAPISKESTENAVSRFETFSTGINTRYSDYGIGLFRDKFISYSSRKIGALAKKDPATNEPYTKLFCSDVLEDWDLTRPLLFSSILNKNENLGSLTFSLDGNTIYFTKSKKGDTQTFQMYKANMDDEELGRWTNIVPVSFNNDLFSYENPHLSRDGKLLYFASNMEPSVGGFDIFQVEVFEDGSFGTIEPVKGDINTPADEKFPYTSVDGKFLFFSSTGHQSIGGYDVFKSRKSEEGFKLIINLGNTINGEKDEIAFIPATQSVAYITSNRVDGHGSYDIYKVREFTIEQKLLGQALDFETSIPLANVEVLLIDTDGVEVASVTTNPYGQFEFPIESLEYYTIVASKDGFQKGITIFNTDNTTPEYKVDVSLRTKPAEIIETEEKSYIKINNIQFDYDSAVIKQVSTITLNSVVRTLQENPEIKVVLNAHTDMQGSNDYNLKLSHRRAASAVQYLIEKGISSDRLEAKGYGELQPLIACDPCSDVEHETNRRIEFIILEE